MSWGYNLGDLWNVNVGKYGMGREARPRICPEALKSIRPTMVGRSKKWEIEKPPRDVRERLAECDIMKIKRSECFEKKLCQLSIVKVKFYN